MVLSIYDCVYVFSRVTCFRAVATCDIESRSSPISYNITLSFVAPEAYIRWGRGISPLVVTGFPTKAPCQILPRRVRRHIFLSNLSKFDQAPHPNITARSEVSSRCAQSSESIDVWRNVANFL